MGEIRAFRWRLAGGITAALMILGATWYGAHHFYAETELNNARERAGIYKASLVSALEQYDHLPALLAEDPFIIASAVTLRSGQLSLVNKRLEQFAALTDVDAIYLMKADGETVATSNWNEEVSYLGQNYGFRPYFKRAMEGLEGHYFAIGATTGRPGYFISAPVRDADDIPRGVIALKVEFDRLIEAWRAAGERIFVANPDGVVVLSTEPGWTFHTTGPIAGETRRAFEQARKFLDHPLPDLGIDQSGMKVGLGHETFLQTVTEVGLLGWRLHFLTSDQDVVFKSWQSVLFVAVSITSLLAVFLLIYSRRIRKALKESQLARAALAREIDERKAAEKRLESAQKDLRQASKLAALGQLSASVSHELGQPIAAMQNYLASARIPGADIGADARDIFTRLGRLAERMGHITRQLKFFAKPGEKHLGAFDLRDAIANALEMMAGDIKRRGVTVNIDQPDRPVPAYGDQMRIEQVLVNLFRNGLDAMPSDGPQELCVELEASDEGIRLAVADRGEGLPDGMEDHVFDPFFTTKASGEGLGLGLAISASILSDHDGRLEARNRDGGGAEFSLHLPLHLPN